MVKKQEGLARLKNSKKSTRFADIERILLQHGWELQSVCGSHLIFSKTGCLPIMIVKPHGHQKYCHPMDVNKVIAALEVEEEDRKVDEQEE